MRVSQSRRLKILAVCGWGTDHVESRVNNAFVNIYEFFVMLDLYTSAFYF